MSINVTVNGNRLNIRRGRMVLSDLDQIKKNERDRRRRLRLEQVRQQSKEISDRLLERTKNIARDELQKIENNDKLNLKQTYNGRILEVQQKYQEDMADIGEAHISAALQPDYNILIEEKDKKNKMTALKRGKEATKYMKEAQQAELPRDQHQDRLRQVREMENIRSTMIAKLPKKIIPEAGTVCVSVQNEADIENRQQNSGKRKAKKVFAKRSSGKITKTYIKVVGSDAETRSLDLGSKMVTLGESVETDEPILQEQPFINVVTESLVEENQYAVGSKYNDKDPKKEVSTATRYNPDDYLQTAADSTNSDSSSSFSDDSSYFSDSSDQSTNKGTKTTRHVRCPAIDKVQLYDHRKHSSNVYDQPMGVVEKIHSWNEPSAMDLAQEMERAKAAETHVLENRKQNTQKRGDDAALREQVRRDYQNLLQNLDQLASEERKLKACQMERYPKDAHVHEERRKILRDQHKKKLDRALKTLLNEEQCPSCSVKRQITLAPTEHEKDVEGRITWEDSARFGELVETDRGSQRKQKESNISREVQILDMLKKVEKQKRLLLQEFGADLPSDIFNVSAKPLLERDKSVQTDQPATNSQNTLVPRSSSPEVEVISARSEEKDEIVDKTGAKDESSVKKVETAVQTVVEDKTMVRDKSTQVEVEAERQEERVSVDKEIDMVTRSYPIEPRVTVIRAGIESSDSMSSETVQAITNVGRHSPKVTPKKKRYIMKTKKTPSKKVHKSCSTSNGKSASPAKKYSKSLSVSRHRSPKVHSTSDNVPSKKIKMYVDENGVNIEVKPPQVTEVAVDVSTQSTQLYTVGSSGRPATKSQWVQTKSRRIHIKDMSDTSTTFASPPPVRPRDLLEALSNNMSILEMLDSSVNESTKRSRADVSPVSTPETPSPRTMRIPSNIPHPDRLRSLLGNTSTDSQTNDKDTSSSTKQDYSASTDLSCQQRTEHLSAEEEAVHSNHPVSMEFCLCSNPDCKQMHVKFDEIRRYALKNCPQILQKYEDLQTTCAERIVSLTNLIDKVRNEQRGMEFSVIDSHDETSLMQLPAPQIPDNDLQSVRKLVENIEAIHRQLAKTLFESQKIVTNKTAVEDGADDVKETAALTNGRGSVAGVRVSEVKAEVEKDKTKPKIINDEKVNIPLNRLKVRNVPQQLTTSTPNRRDVWSPPNNYEDEVIEKISREILEQSEGINDNLRVSRETYDSMTARYSIQTSTGGDAYRNLDSARGHRNDTGTKRSMNKEGERTKDFVPLLGDIPKVSRTVDTNNGRSKPPVSLLSGPYRSEIDSSGHELSTIIEFDTPDTVNKSQSNRSPLTGKKVTESQATKSVGGKSPEHRASSFADTASPSVEKLCESPVAKLFTIASTQKLRDTSTSFDSSKMCKDMKNRKLTKEKDERERDIDKELGNKEARCDTSKERQVQMEQAQRFSNTSTDAKNNNDKITTTSSSSFSELSGISQIASTPSSVLLNVSSPEEMETALKKLGLGWAITTLKKTREASALSSSSNSDATPINTAKRIMSPVKKQFDNNYGLPDFSDVSSISIKEASKSTEQAVLLKGRTSTPKLQNSNSNSGEMNTSNTNNSVHSPEPDEGLTIPNVSLAKPSSNLKRLGKL